MRHAVRSDSCSFRVRGVKQAHVKVDEQRLASFCNLWNGALQVERLCADAIPAKTVSRCRPVRRTLPAWAHIKVWQYWWRTLLSTILKIF